MHIDKICTAPVLNRYFDFATSSFPSTQCTLVSLLTGWNQGARRMMMEELKDVLTQYRITWRIQNFLTCNGKKCVKYSMNGHYSRSYAYLYPKAVFHYDRAWSHISCLRYTKILRLRYLCSTSLSTIDSNFHLNFKMHTVKHFISRV